MRYGKVISGNLYVDGELSGSFSTPKCPLFSFCNCKTAACRVVLPDEGCYWYRYFKSLIEENKNEQNY